MKQIDNILDFPSNSIYAFVDDSSKSIYASHSTNSLFEIAKILTDLNEGFHKCTALLDLYKANKLKLVVLKSYPIKTSQYTIRAEFTDLMEQLEKEGWNNLRGDYNAGEFKLKAYVYTLPKTKTPMFYVIAESKRKEKLVLGVFNSIDLGKEWISKTYPNGISGRIVPLFAANDETVNYHTTYGIKLLE